MTIKHTSVASTLTSRAPGCIRVGRTLFISMRMVFMVTAMLGATGANAQTEGGQYNLFNPVPRSEMREFSIDRPDVTEAPATVDAGHFQFEGDLIKWTKDHQGESGRTLSFFNGLYKVGLLKSWDLHVGLEMYNVYQDTEGNTVNKGYGATTIRLKHNFWGNDGSTTTALGMIPYISFLSKDQGGEQIFGVGFPFSFDISEKLGGGAQAQIDFLPGAKGGHDAVFLQTIVIGGAVVGALDFYAELAGYFQNNEDIFLANGGLIYNISDNVKVDVAANVGLTDPSPTRVYLGLSFRI